MTAIFFRSKKIGFFGITHGLQKLDKQKDDMQHLSKTNKQKKNATLRTALRRTFFIVTLSAINDVCRQGVVSLSLGFNTAPPACHSLRKGLDHVLVGGAGDHAALD